MRTKKGLRIHIGKMHSQLDNMQSYIEKKKIAEYKCECEEKCDYLCKSKVNLDVHVATAHSNVKTN